MSILYIWVLAVLFYSLLYRLSFLQLELVDSVEIRQFGVSGSTPESLEEVLFFLGHRYRRRIVFSLEFALDADRIQSLLVLLEVLEDGLEAPHPVLSV